MQVKIKPKARKYIESLPEKSQRIIAEHLMQLEDLQTARDIERIQENDWRMHIAHTYTAFFHIEGDIVFIDLFMSIEEAHKRYGRI